MSFSAEFLARYEVIRKLGQGGMGEVVLARQKSSGAIVAVKTILAGNFDRGEGRQRFMREARITQSLDHPAIIRVLDQGEQPEFLYLVLEYVSGGDLSQFLARRSRLDPATFYRIAIPLLEGVAHAHRAGVLHRDLKPGNVFLDEELRPRIADFGLAKDQTNQGFRTATGIIMGTPAYIAPELALGQRAVKESDQYALGIMLYELLSGKPPFDSENMMGLLRKHLDEIPVRLEQKRLDCPDDLANAIHRAIEKKPEARWPSVSAFADAVKATQERAGTAWVARAANVTMFTPVATETAAGVAGSTLEQSRVTEKQDIPIADETPVTEGGPAPKSSRTTGRTRATAGTSTKSRPSMRVVAAPPARPPWVIPAVSAALAAVLVLGAVLLMRPANPEPIARASPSPPAAVSTGDEIELVIHRRIDRAVLSWKPAIKAAVVRVTLEGRPSPEPVHDTDSITLEGLDKNLIKGRLNLEIEGRDAVDLPIRLEALSFSEAQEKLRALRPARQDGKDIYLDFFENLDKATDADPFRVLEDAMSDELPAVGAAAAASGFHEMMKRYATGDLIQRLEQATDLLENVRDETEAFKLLQEVCTLARFEVLLLALHVNPPDGGLVFTEALRMLYGAAPGEMTIHLPRDRTAKAKIEPRSVLGGRGDYRRSCWKFFVPDRALADRLASLILEDTVMVTRSATEIIRGIDLLRAADLRRDDYASEEFFQETGEEILAWTGTKVNRGPTEIPQLLAIPDAKELRHQDYPVAQVFIEFAGAEINCLTLELPSQPGRWLSFIPIPGMLAGRKGFIGCQLPFGLILDDHATKLARIHVRGYPGVGKLSGNRLDKPRENVTEVEIKRIWIRLARS